MLIHPMKEKMTLLKLTGMLDALEDQGRTPELVRDLSFEDRLGLLVDQEILIRENKRTATRLKAAKLRQNATLEDLDFRTHRGLNRPLIQTLSMGQWIENHQNVLITGPTGIGKSYLSESLGNKACRLEYRVLLIRVPRLFHSLALARSTGRLLAFFKTLATQDVLI